MVSDETDTDFNECEFQKCAMELRWIMGVVRVGWGPLEKYPYENYWTIKQSQSHITSLK